MNALGQRVVRPLVSTFVRTSVCAALFGVSLLVGCTTINTRSGDVTPDIRAAVQSADRTDADRQVDKRRDPETLLAFAGVRTGMRVLEMGAGGGYTAELLARIVGPKGTVYAQDGKTEMPWFVRYAERAKKPVMQNVVRLLRDFDDPFPADAAKLDLITFFFAYHDTTFMPVDRAKMNRALFNALKPGGHLVIADHSAKPGDGINVAKSLHRIEESVLRREIEAAGFRLVGESNHLRNPADPRTERIFQPKVPVDEFVLRYLRP